MNADGTGRETAEETAGGTDQGTTARTAVTTAVTTAEGYTLREIDLRFGRPKGSAFRAFKRSRERLREGVDFFVLSARTAGVEIERLRAAGRIYRSSINAVVLTESGFERVRAELERD